MLQATHYRALLLTAIIVSFGSTCFLQGCASGFARFYKSASANSAPLAVAPATPQLVWSRDPGRDGKQLAQQGYLLIGTSSFRTVGDPWYEKEAVEQGKKVGAAVVLLSVNWGLARYGYPSYQQGYADADAPGADVPAIHAYFASYWGEPTR